MMERISKPTLIMSATAIGLSVASIALTRSCRRETIPSASVAIDPYSKIKLPREISIREMPREISRTTRVETLNLPSISLFERGYLLDPKGRVIEGTLAGNTYIVQLDQFYKAGSRIGIVYKDNSLFCTELKSLPKRSISTEF